MKIKFVFEAYAMPQPSTSPAGHRLLSMKAEDYVTVPSQMTIDMEPVEREKIETDDALAELAVDDMVHVAMAAFESRVRDDVRKALGLRSKAEQIKALKAAAPLTSAA